MDADARRWDRNRTDAHRIGHRDTEDTETSANPGRLAAGTPQPGPLGTGNPARPDKTGRGTLGTGNFPRCEAAGGLEGRSHPFIAAVAAAIDGQSLLSPGEGVVAGVSGGPDSVALVLALHTLGRSPGRGYVVHVAHLDHGLRGAEAEADARFVHQLAQRLGLPLTTEGVTAPCDPSTGKMRESAARRLRYRFLARVAESVGAAAVAVGHTRDDQVETVLMRLIRGGALQDLRGMAPARGMGASPLRLIRPMLGIPRAAVLAFLRDAGVAFREDRSNRDLRYRRNRVRHELLPFLVESFGAGVGETLVGLGRTAQREYTRLAAGAAQLISETAVTFEPSKVIVSASALRRAKSDVREEVLRQIVARLPSEPALSGGSIRRLDGLLGGTGSRRTVPLGNGLVARLVYDRVVFQAGPAAPSAGPLEPVPLFLEGETTMPALGFLIQATVLDRAPDDVASEPLSAYLDAAAIAGGVYVRTRRPGDRIRPLGAPGERKLKDFLIDRKVPAAKRDRLPLVCDDAGIVWVVGHAIAHRVRVTPQTRRVLALCARRKP